MLNVPLLAAVIWRGCHDLGVSSDRLEEPGSGTYDPRVQGEWFINYTTAAHII